MGESDPGRTDAATKADEERRQRKVMRVVMSCWAIAGGAVFVLFFRDYRINGIYAPYLGYVLIGVGVLAMLGVNVFWGGPLDKRRD